MRTRSWPRVAIFVVVAMNERAIVDALSSSSSSSSSCLPPSTAKVVLRVCTSPGCNDDGSHSTLDRLLALRRPGMTVVGGRCVSLCGSGPVVEVVNVATNGDEGGIVVDRRRRVRGGDAIMSLLNECVVVTATITDSTTANEEVGGGMTSSSSGYLKPHLLDRLIRGYESSIEGDAAYASKDYERAVQSYSDAIESGRKPALLLQEARGEEDEEEYGRYPSGLIWLVRSLKNSCRSRLLLRDVDGARRDAFAATVFSRNTDPDAHECLSEVCAVSHDALGELQGLKSAIREYDRIELGCRSMVPMMSGMDAVARADMASRSNHASARRRELGFRMIKLEKMLRG